MHCSIFRSTSKDFTYIYLNAGHEFDDLPDSLKKVFGEPRFVMDLELNSGRKLAYEDVKKVMADLAEHGYHLQLPPTEDLTGWLDLPAKRESLL